MHILIRQADLSDIDETAVLFDGYRQFYGQASDLVLARTFLHERLALRESVIFVAVDDSGTRLGFTQLYPSFTSVGARRTWILNDLFVAQEHRGKGVASKLLNAAKAHAQATGARRLDLSTAVDNPAQKLYEAHGYVKQSGFFHYSLVVE